jgi:hypothetical protein
MADPWFKLTTAERRAAERAAHQFSDDIGGHASNYRVPPDPYQAGLRGAAAASAEAMASVTTIKMVHTNINTVPVKVVGPKLERG